jgi:hypothetical protein
MLDIWIFDLFIKRFLYSHSQHLFTTCQRLNIKYPALMLTTNSFFLELEPFASYVIVKKNTK